MVQLCGDGSMDLRTKREDFGLMYAGFCPFHAHTYHTEPCSKWTNLIGQRKAKRTRVQTEGEKKDAQRSAAYNMASSSSTSGTRF